MTKRYTSFPPQRVNNSPARCFPARNAPEERAPLIQPKDDLDMDQLSTLGHVLGYNVGEVHKCLIWMMKHRDNKDLLKPYAIHMLTNVSDVLIDVAKIANAAGVGMVEMEDLAQRREQERAKEFAARNRPYV